MRNAWLCAALALLILTAPLGALHCGNCGPEGCALEKTEPPRVEMGMQEGHCHSALEPADVPGSGHGMADDDPTPMDCCAEAAPEAQPQSLATSSSVDTGPMAPLILARGTVISEIRETAERPPDPPRPGQPPLYHLHASLLI